MDDEQKKKAKAAARKAVQEFWSGVLDQSVDVATDAFAEFFNAPTMPDPDPKPDPKPDPDPKPKTDFRVFEDINYRGRPNLRAMGMEPIQIYYESAFFDNKQDHGSTDFNLPSPSRVKQAAVNASPVSIIDIERWWSGDTSGQTPPPPRGIDAYEDVLSIYRNNLRAGNKFGLYGTFPTRNYWGPVKGGSREAVWKKGNENLVPLSGLVDFTFPSIYTFYEDRDGWLKYARAQIEEAKRIAPDKPCYPFLWPEYHPGGKGPIEGDYWRIQLDLCRELADGVVIWTLSNTKNIDFEDIRDRGWWRQTVRFLDGL